MTTTMKVRWLGDACIEIFAKDHIVIDPNFTVAPKKPADIVLLTHEHDDHFSPDDFARFGEKTPLYAPKASLEKFDVDGRAVAPGETIATADGTIAVLDCDCWKAEASVSYFYGGILHSGDSAYFPDAEGVKAIFSACFSDFYDDYIAAFLRLEPTIVVPFHYDPEESMDEAEGLKKRCDEEGIPCRILQHGESIEIERD